MFIDDDRAIGLSDEVVLQHDLHPGMEISEDDLSTLILAEEKEKIRRRAFLLLRYRNRSRQELCDRLNRSGFDAQLVSAIIDELTADGTVDDSRFAEAFVADYTRLKPKGNRFLAAELRRKGIAAPIVKTLLAQRDERDLVRRTIEQKLSDLNLQDPRCRAKAIRRLLNRGFTPRIVYDVLDEFRSSHD